MSCRTSDGCSESGAPLSTDASVPSLSELAATPRQELVLDGPALGWASSVVVVSVEEFVSQLLCRAAGCSVNAGQLAGLPEVGELE
jgi:hypothetical protein